MGLKVYIKVTAWICSIAWVLATLTGCGGMGD